MGVKDGVNRVGWVNLVFWFVGTIMILNMGSSLRELIMASKRISVARGELEQEKVKNQNLAQKVREATSSAYVERVIRDDLDMQIPGDRLVRVKGWEVDGKAAMATKGSDELLSDRKEVPNWVKWFELVAGAGLRSPLE